MDPEDLKHEWLNVQDFFSFKILLCLLLRKNHLQLSYDSNTTINAVGCEEELTFNGEKFISHAKPNKRAEEQELFGLSECS